MTTDRNIFDFPLRRGIMAEIEYPGVVQLIERVVGSAVALSGTWQGETPQSLVTPAFAGFSPIAESGIKVALTTGLTTDRKIFDFPPCRGIMAEIEYPGVAQLVGRDIWECRGGIRNRARRNAAKPCDTGNSGFPSGCRKRHKSGFDHRNDHRQKNL